MSQPVSPPLPRSRLADAAALAACVVLCFLPSLSGIWFGPDDWFRGLTRPPLNPPNWVFGPVWTTLYLLMAVSLWLVWRTPQSPARRLALSWFGGQLLLNAAWSWLFFGCHALGLAFLELLLLAVVLTVAIRAMRRVSPLAAALQGPYLAWVTFAGYLNLGYWWLNSSSH